MARYVGLEVYEPSQESDGRLASLTEYREDVTPGAPADLLGGERFRGARILEVEPIDLDPLASRDEPVDPGQFDLVLCLGSQKNVDQVSLLARLNRRTPMGGHLLIATTVDPRSDISLTLCWPIGSANGRAVPTVDAFRLMLAWTGWRKVVRFTDYRPDSGEALFLCEKTDELVEGSDFAPDVAPYRSLRIGPNVPSRPPRRALNRPVARPLRGPGGARALGTLVALLTVLVLVFVAFPEALGDRPYNVV